MVYDYIKYQKSKKKTLKKKSIEKSNSNNYKKEEDEFIKLNKYFYNIFIILKIKKFFGIIIIKNN